MLDKLLYTLIKKRIFVVLLQKKQSNLHRVFFIFAENSLFFLCNTKIFCNFAFGNFKAAEKSKAIANKIPFLLTNKNN